MNTVMNRLRLIYVLSIFIASNKSGFCQIALQLRRVVISSEPCDNVLVLSNQPTFDVKLIKTQRGNAYYFDDKNLTAICLGSFMPSNIEIRSMHAIYLTFALIRGKVCFIVECEFVNMSDLQIFFKDIRKHDGTNYPKFPVTGLFRYPINRDRFPSPHLMPLATNSLFYRKDIAVSKQFGADASFYLVRERTHDGVLIQEADLVFLSKKFLLTLMIGTNKYGLCIEDYPDFVFILRFENHDAAARFITSVINDIRMDRTTHCPLNWLTEEHIKFMDAYQG